MFNIFKKKKEEEKNGIVVLKSTKPGTCGGTDATQDTNAPTEIASTDMISFYVTSVLPFNAASASSDGENKKITYVSAFALRAGEGIFLFLETREHFADRKNGDLSWALVKDDIFPSLVKLVNDFGVAKKNGFHSTTHGLPQNFGGRIDIKYGDGERISVSNNQSPVLSVSAAEKTAEIFSAALNGEKISLPDISSLKEIRFFEERENGGYTRAALTINADGSGVNEKKQRFDAPDVYESRKTVEAETIEAIKENIKNTGLLAWSGLPGSAYAPEREKALTFVFENGTEISVKDGREVPDELRGGFFNIELEMTTKH